MSTTEFKYKGKTIVIREDHPNATVSVDGREFACHHHHLPDGKGLPMWMCEEAYFASPDIKELARHFADYGYMFDDPGRVVVNDAGEVVKPKKTSGGHDHRTRKGR
jgi:hypothetical protein